MTDLTTEPRSSLVLDQTADGRIRVPCRLGSDTARPTRSLLAELPETTPQSITQHVRAIHEESELEERRTCKPSLQVGQAGLRRVEREVLPDSLLANLTGGDRIRRPRRMRFRPCASARLSESPAIEDERLEDPTRLSSPDDFDEVLGHIRDILALAVDYRASETDTAKLFQVVQNKLHHAVTGMTAPELIAARADATRPNMGLTTWKGGVLPRGDVTVAKNYLREDEIGELNRVVVMFLDYAEDQTRRKKAIHLADWTKKLDEFLRFHERAVLPDAGRVRRENADEKANAEFERFAARRRELAEAEGEADNLKALEDLAKELPTRRKRKPEEET